MVVVARSPCLPGPRFVLPAQICCATRWSNRKCIDSRPISGSRYSRLGKQIIGALKSGERYQWPISDPPFLTRLKKLLPKIMLIDSPAHCRNHDFSYEIIIFYSTSWFSILFCYCSRIFKLFGGWVTCPWSGPYSRSSQYALYRIITFKIMETFFTK